MQKVTKRDKQVFWIFGVFERLANLGYLHNPPFHIAEEKIDFFLEIDSYCQLLFDSDEEFESLVMLVCRDANVTDPEQVAIFTHLARDYKDNRDQLVKFALCQNV